MRRSLVNLWEDLRRRRVVRVAAIYAASAWIIVQVASEFVPALYLPSWVMTALVASVIIGFPIACVLAWLFDIGPAGVVRTRPGSATGIAAIVASIGLLAAGTAGLVVILVPDLDTAPEVAHQKPSPPIENSIAVLPFVNLSADSALGSFADGVSELIIHQLAQLAELHVIARTSTFVFKGKDVDTREIGRRLNVGRILEGSVQRSNGRLRIAAQLIDAETGTHVWSKLFESSDEDIFKVQDEISIAVANAMQVSLSEKQKIQLASGMTDNYDAYELYLLGRHEFEYSTAMDVDASKASIAYYERALEIDPDFALAWAGLADSTLSYGLSGEISMAESLEKARAAIDQALEIDPNLGLAYQAELSYALMTHNADAGRAAFQRAVELNPNNPLAYHYYAMLEDSESDLSRLELLEKAVSLDPVNPFPSTKFTLAWANSDAGNYDRAMELLEQLAVERVGTEEERAFAQSPAVVTFLYGRLDEAVARARLLIERGYDGPDIQVILARTYLLMSDRDRSRDAIAAVRQYWKDIDEDVDPSDLLYLLAATANLAEMLDLAGEMDAELENNPRWVSNSMEASLYLERYDVLVGQYEQYLEFCYFWDHAYAAFAYAKLDDEYKARESVDRSKEFWASQSRNSPYFLLWRAQHLIAAGEVDEVFAVLNRAYDAGAVDYIYLYVNPLFESIRLDPRFIDLVERMKARVAEMRERVEEAEASGNWQEIIGNPSRRDD